MKRIIRYKVYLDRSRNYIAYINFLMIGIIFAEQVGIKLVWWLYPVIVAVTLFICVLMGYLDKKYIRSEEQKELTSTNPYFKDILDKLNNNCKCN